MIDLYAGRSIYFRNRFGVLFALLLCVLLIPPYFQNTEWVGIFWRLMFTLVLLWALYAVAGKKKVLLLAVLLLVPTLSSTWLADPDQEKYLAYIDNITNIVYFGLICTFMGQYILTKRTITLEVIFAAMCLYMLIAVLWAAIYTNLELYYEGAFTFWGMSADEAGINKDNLYTHMVYYSFVTLSTLGYGDTVPVHHVAQNWAAVEAMVGQFYIAIVIARLVSLYTLEGDEPSPRE